MQCAWCKKKIKGEKGSHGICDDCLEKEEKKIDDE